jgi:hypothetical protein
MLRQITGVVILAVAALAGTVVRAQSNATQPSAAPPNSTATVDNADNLAEVARAAHYVPVKPQAAMQAKVELATAIRELERWLSRNPERAAGWKRYLQWADLENVIAGQEPPAAEVVAQVHRKFTTNKPGLELPHFTRTRDALAKYAAVAISASDEKLQAQTSDQLAQLATHLEAYEKNPASSDDALAIGRGLAWLSQAQQAGHLQTAVLREYGHPNLYASVSERLAAVGMERYVNQVTPVRENILGTDLHGTARMTGRTSMGFVPNSRAATFNILLGGTAYSKNVGYNGPVTVHTTGVTSISGVKQIQMNANGLFGYRAGANCRTRSTINDLCANCGLIEKIAWKRAGQQKSQSEAIASSRAAARVAGQMDREAAGMIAEQNARYNERFKQPLARRNALPSELHFSSSADRAFVRMLELAPGRLAAPEVPPEHDAAHDIALRVHESLAVNFGESTLSGYEMTDVRLEKLIRDELKTELPEELRVTLDDGTLDPDKEPWSIIFAKELPVQARFQNGGLSLAIRADGFTRGEGDEPGTYKPALTELVEIAADYKIEKTDVGATLRREGDVQVRFPNRANPDQITVRDNATVTFMRRKFRSLFKEEFVGQGIKLKDRWERAGTLGLREIKSEGAWLSLGWQMGDAQPAGAE